MIKESPYKIDGLEFETQEEYREYLSKSNKYSNAYEPWTDELDEVYVVKTFWTISCLI